MEPERRAKSYYGHVPEIRFLPLDVIIRREMDFRPEVLRVPQSVAESMDFSEPVDVSIYRDEESGWTSTDPPRMQYARDSDRTKPQVVLEDGHHRLAAAVQTGRSWLPVSATAINARNEKIDALVHLSDNIERQIRRLKNSLMPPG